MNRLAHETSPYLRQHASNPVDWYPWGPEALEAARREDKPLFVSIGYASCHWCHVMAHESFEDPGVAGELAKSFVSIKVDREERPDVDAVYMAAVQALSGHGGWPMSVFCLPDGRPFYGGTYFPPSDRHGLPSFRRLLRALREAWEHRRGEVESQARALRDAVASELRLVDRLAGRRLDGPPAPHRVLEDAVRELAGRFDPDWGGFGAPPKFPRPTLVELALRHHLRTGDERSLAMAATTLDAMAAGGIYDHVCGGFARYATDREWLVPHFEKMLTDQALLARTYLRSWLVTASADHLQVATETLDAMVQTMAGPGGGLCSSFDADADGREGGHVTWTPSQVNAALSAAGLDDLSEAVTDWYGVTTPGNWEGVTIVRRPLGGPLRRPVEVDRAREALAAARARRPQPSRDGKVITEWNAMAAAVLAEAAFVTGRQDWGRRAEDIVEFIFAELRRAGDGRLLRSWQDGQAQHLAFAGDYAWVVEGCTRLAELRGSPEWSARGASVADRLLELFWDPGPDGRGAGLFVTAHDAEPLIVRPKDLLDGALPSAHAAAAAALARLGALTGEARYHEVADQLVELGSPLLSEHPTAVADLIGPAVQMAEGAEVVVAGNRPDLLNVLRSRWLPDAVIAWGVPSGSPLWQGRAAGHAYVCRHFACTAPVTEPDALGAQLDELVHQGPG